MFIVGVELTINRSQIAARAVEREPIAHPAQFAGEPQIRASRGQHGDDGGRWEFLLHRGHERIPQGPSAGDSVAGSQINRSMVTSPAISPRASRNRASIVS